MDQVWGVSRGNERGVLDRKFHLCPPCSAAATPCDRSLHEHYTYMPNCSDCFAIACVAQKGKFCHLSVSYASSLCDGG